MGADGEYWKLGKLQPDLDTPELQKAKERKDNQRQGRTFVLISAQRKRFLRNKGCM